jgi:glycosyltransferase involved in cell wall biosynthesis
LRCTFKNIITREHLDDPYLTQILDNEELEREKSVRGRAKVIKEFTWGAVVDRLEGIYGSVADIS